MASRLLVRGPLEQVLEALGRLTPPEASWIEQLAWALARPNTLHASRRNVHHHYDLGNDFYQALARRAAGLHLRLLRHAGRAARRGAAREAGPRLPQAPAPAGRDGDRGGMRLGRAGAAHGALLRRAREGVQRLARADRVRPRPRRARAPRRPGRVHRRRLPQRHAAGATPSCRWACSSTSVCPTTTTSREVLDRVLARRTAAACCTSSAATSPAPLNAWIRRRIFPGAYPPTLAEVATRILVAGADVRRGRREPAAALRAHAGALAPAVRRDRAPGPRPVRRGVSAGVGAVPRRDPKPPSPAAGCSSSRSSSHRPTRIRRTGSGPTSTARRSPTHGSLRRPDRRRRPRRLHLRPRAPPRRVERPRLDRARFPRDKVCAGWVTPGVFQLLDLDPDAYRATGLTIQPITGFRTSVLASAAVETRYRRIVSYAIRRREFDDFLLRRADVRVLEGTPLGTLERRGGVWVANGDIEAPIVVGAGGHFCPVARHVRGPHDVVAARRREGSGVPAGGRRHRRGRRGAGAVLLPRPRGLRLVRAGRATI